LLKKSTFYAAICLLHHIAGGQKTRKPHVTFDKVGSRFSARRSRFAALQPWVRQGSGKLYQLRFIWWRNRIVLLTKKTVRQQENDQSKGAETHKFGFIKG
jgi:hypothetical protein